MVLTYVYRSQTSSPFILRAADLSHEVEDELAQVFWGLDMGRQKCPPRCPSCLLWWAAKFMHGKKDAPLAHTPIRIPPPPAFQPHNNLSSINPSTVIRLGSCIATSTPPPRRRPKWPHQKVNIFVRSCHPYACPPHRRFSVGCHPSCDSRNTSRRFAPGARNACLAGENPTCSIPALQGCEGL